MRRVVQLLGYGPQEASTASRGQPISCTSLIAGKRTKKRRSKASVIDHRCFSRGQNAEKKRCERGSEERTCLSSSNTNQTMETVVPQLANSTTRDPRSSVPFLGFPEIMKCSSTKRY